MKPKPHPNPPQPHTRAPQYYRTIDLVSQKPPTTFGLLKNQGHASAPTKAGHVNCQPSKGLRKFKERYFHNVFDEIVHTGFSRTERYLIGIRCTRRTPPAQDRP